MSIEVDLTNLKKLNSKELNKYKKYIYARKKGDNYYLDNYFLNKNNLNFSNLSGYLYNDKILNTYPILTFEINKYSDILDEERNDISKFLNSCINDYTDENITNLHFFGDNEEHLYIIYGKIDTNIVLTCSYYPKYIATIYTLDSELLKKNIIDSKYIKVIKKNFISPRIESEAEYDNIPDFLLDKVDKKINKKKTINNYIKLICKKKDNSYKNLLYHLINFLKLKIPDYSKNKEINLYPEPLQYAFSEKEIDKDSVSDLENLNISYDKLIDYYIINNFTKTSEYAALTPDMGMAYHATITDHILFSPLLKLTCN